MAKKKPVDEMADLITQVDAARLRGVTRAAISYLVSTGRLRSKEMFGRKLVYRSEVLGFQPETPGPKAARAKKSIKRKGTEK